MYSQNNEEQIIAEYFTKHQPIYKRYLSIGENDGKTLSNVYALYEKGWRGVNIEASPKAFERLKHNQPECSNINALVAGKMGELDFYESGQLLGTGDVALVSSTREDERARWVSLNMPFEKNAMACYTVDQLLADCDKHFDLLSIDIEGMELEVLPTIDLNGLGIQLAVIEWNGKHMDEFTEIMRKQGFRLKASNAENLIFTKIRGVSFS